MSLIPSDLPLTKLSIKNFHNLPTRVKTLSVHYKFITSLKFVKDSGPLLDLSVFAPWIVCHISIPSHYKNKALETKMVPFPLPHSVLLRLNNEPISFQGLKEDLATEPPCHPRAVSPASFLPRVLH